MTKPGATQSSTPAPAARKARTPLNKQVKLVELANKRVPKALRSIQLIGALGKYQPSQDQVEKVEQALLEAVNQAVRDLAPISQIEKQSFAL